MPKVKCTKCGHEFNVRPPAKPKPATKATEPKCEPATPAPPAEEKPKSMFEKILDIEL